MSTLRFHRDPIDALLFVAAVLSWLAVACGCMPAPIVPSPVLPVPAPVDPPAPQSAEAERVVREVVEEVIASRPKPVKAKRSSGSNDRGETQQPSVVVKFPKIQLWTRKNCEPCERAKADLIAAGADWDWSDDPELHPAELRGVVESFPVVYWELGDSIRHYSGWHGIADLRRRVSKTLNEVQK